MASGKSCIIGVNEGDDRELYDHSEPKNSFISWHLIGGANTDHETLCGVDADDPTCGTFGTVQPKRGQKVTCTQCKNDFLHMKEMNITIKDFDCE